VEEMVRNPVLALPDESYRAETEEMFRRVQSGEVVAGHETLRRRKDGRLLDVSITYTPIHGQGGRIVAVANIVRDITESKRAETQLRESERKYRLIAENTSDLILTLDREFKIRYVSPSHETVCGLGAQEYEGKPVFEFVHPEDVIEVVQKLKQLFVSVTPAQVEYRYKRADGGWVLMEARGMPVVGEHGLVESVVIVARDITERKRTEELLRNSEKLSVIGELAAGVAHEIRNPLTALRGFVQLLQQEAKANRNYLDIMLQELDRIHFIVSELLLLAKPQMAQFQELDLTALIRSTLTLVEPQALLNNVQIVTEFGPNLPMIYGEENQLKQVFINILKNSIEAMPDGGEIFVVVNRQDEEHLRIRVVDQGVGIPDSLIPRLGEPFYTTKDKGTGLGLMVSYKILQHHQGLVRIQSEVGRGTTLDIVLPTAARAAKAMPCHAETMENGG
jgi:two-component system sporulation sensor kinase A